jgi:hypothetical protein
MSLTVADRTLLRVICPRCEQMTEKGVAWLQGRDEMPCPHCKRAIDLHVHPNGILIREMAFNCERIEAEMKAGRIPE